MTIKIQTITDNEMDQNAYIVNLEGSSECVVIDPGMSGEEVVSTLQSQQLTPVAILCTHGHYDHIKGVPALREAFPGVPTYIGAKDADKFEEPHGNLSLHFGPPQSIPAAEKTVSHGNVLSLAGLKFEVRETPGHSAGHVIYILREDLPYRKVKTMLFCGDVLFAGSIGRTDFYDGNTEKLINSIKTQILTLPDNTIVYSGHMGSTTVEREKIYNPYF
ncbi:MAG: MBL fold metallo-hydrolase [Thermoguttaceae bacterium]|nr:MBL fold metallo-hydrolase [Thermoguttaceae bacterium]